MQVPQARVLPTILPCRPTCASSSAPLARGWGATYRRGMAGVVALVACTLMLGITFGLFLCQDEMSRLHRRLRDRLAPPPTVPDGPAIEELARALRRLHGEVRAPRPGTTMARRRGTAAAYEDLLVQAAHALGVPDTLSELREGTEREAERLRLEHVLREAGLVID